VDETFAGVQFGADVARLNIGGWNVHLGSTAGFLQSNGSVVGGAFSFQDVFAGGATVGGGPFTNSTQIPFAGIYAAATYGGFFIDGLVRWEDYQTTLNAPSSNLFNQRLDAQGISFSASTGYNWQVPNTNWFIEPSIGVIISRTWVDDFNYATAGTPGKTSFNGTLHVHEIESDIGRAGLRVGTTINGGSVIWQPFAAFSVWHEFGPNIKSDYATCNSTSGVPGCAFRGGIPDTIQATSSTTTFGTFEQYSLGISAALAGTGWLGFARVDFRDGPDLQGWSGTGGIRYQFTPGASVAGVMPLKAPAKAAIVQAVSWTGFYLGGFGGAFLGSAKWDFAGGGTTPHIGGYDFGGDIGYRYQMGPWVVGVEGDFSGTNLNGGKACAPLLDNFNGTPNPMFQMTCNASANWIATATGQIGYAWDQVLLYVKGGAAFTDEHLSATCNLSAAEQFANGKGFPNQQCANPKGVATTNLTASTNRTGWVIGYGIDFAFTPNWSARAETNYISFGDHNVAASDGSVLNGGIHVWEAKIGVNYRFAG
jgi:opacity protein-like surface antigen